MNVNDRIALEIGRAKLAQILAEAQRDEAIVQLNELNEENKKDDPDKPKVK